jgi:hypothetical protein
VAVEFDAVFADGAGRRPENGREYLVHRLSARRIDELAVDEGQSSSADKGRRPRKKGGGELYGAGAGRAYDSQSRLPRDSGKSRYW